MKPRSISKVGRVNLIMPQTYYTRVENTFAQQERTVSADM